MMMAWSMMTTETPYIKACCWSGEGDKKET
jgi:hypothetical protein